MLYSTVKILFSCEVQTHKIWKWEHYYRYISVSGTGYLQEISHHVRNYFHCHTKTKSDTKIALELNPTNISKVFLFCLGSGVFSTKCQIFISSNFSKEYCSFSVLRLVDQIIDFSIVAYFIQTPAVIASVIKPRFMWGFRIFYICVPGSVWDV